MLDVIKFILDCVLKFLRMLFSIDVGNNMNLGTIMCVCFIFLPLVILFVKSLKTVLIDEIDENYDMSKRRDRDTYVGKHTKKYRTIYHGKHEYKNNPDYHGRHEFKGRHGRF